MIELRQFGLACGMFVAACDEGQQPTRDEDFLEDASVSDSGGGQDAGFRDDATVRYGECVVRLTPWEEPVRSCPPRNEQDIEISIEGLRIACGEDAASVLMLACLDGDCRPEEHVCPSDDIGFDDLKRRVGEFADACEGQGKIPVVNSCSPDFVVRAGTLTNCPVFLTDCTEPPEEASN